MNSLSAYLALRAANERRAVPKATRRHVHLSSRPLVIIGYHLAGDVGAPLALMWGTDPGARPRTAVVPEPRNRQLRFEALGAFGSAFVEYLAAYSETRLEGSRGGRNDLVCVDAPQVVVPNQATAEWLFGIVGRFTRYLRTDRNPAPPTMVPRAGMHLSFFHDRPPGSSLVLRATEILSSHWQTGQLAAEDLNLSALLGWIAPDDGTDGPAAARVSEVLPPAGPLSDPNWDAKELSGLIEQWHVARNDVARSAVLNELDAEIREQLNHTWEDCWRALRLVATLSEGDTVARRWAQDRRAWTRHHTAMQAGTARFRNIPTPVQSAGTLRVLERATTDLQAEMAFDDPLVMAAYVASGEALSARVASIDITRKVPGHKCRVIRPLVKFEPLLPFTCPVGTVLFLASAPGVEFEVLNVARDMVHAQVNKGAISRKTLGRLPKPGDEVVLSRFTMSTFYQSRTYDEIPWTHRLPKQIEEQPQ